MTGIESCGDEEGGDGGDGAGSCVCEVCCGADARGFLHFLASLARSGFSNLALSIEKRCFSLLSSRKQETVEM